MMKQALIPILVLALTLIIPVYTPPVYTATQQQGYVVIHVHSNKTVDVAVVMVKNEPNPNIIIHYRNTTIYNDKIVIKSYNKDIENKVENSTKTINVTYDNTTKQLIMIIKHISISNNTRIETVTRGIADFKNVTYAEGDLTTLVMETKTRIYRHGVLVNETTNKQNITVAFSMFSQ
jgi:hypothetical protein